MRAFMPYLCGAKYTFMSVLVGSYSRVIVQGFTGKEGTFHAEQMIEYGTRLWVESRRAKEVANT